MTKTHKQSKIKFEHWEGTVLTFKLVTKIALSTIICIGCAYPAFADTTGPGDAEASSSAPSGSGSSSGSDLQQKRSLEGHVQDEAVALETGIKDLTKTLHHMKRSAFDIFIEVQRQNMVVVGEPDVIGPIIIPAIPSPSGMMAMGGFLPPRKKFLDYFQGQLGDLMKMTQTEVSGLVLPADASDQAKTDMQTISDSLSTFPKDLQAIADVTQGPKFNNYDIARAAQLLQDHIQAVEKATKSLNSEMRKEVDKTKKDLRDIDKAIKKEGQGK